MCYYFLGFFVSGGVSKIQTTNFSKFSIRSSILYRYILLIKFIKNNLFTLIFYLLTGMPSLAYNAMLKMTGVELELFSSQEMAEFFTKVNKIFY